MERTSKETKGLVRELSDIVRRHPPKRHVVIYESGNMMGYGEVLFFDRKGFHSSIEPMGMWVAYAQDIPGPQVTDLSRKELEEKLERYGSDARAEARRAINNYMRRREYP